MPDPARQPDDCLDPHMLDALIQDCIGDKLTGEERYEIVVALRTNLVPHVRRVRAETERRVYLEVEETIAALLHHEPRQDTFYDGVDWALHRLLDTLRRRATPEGG